MKEFNELPPQVQQLIKKRMLEQGNKDTTRYNKNREQGGFYWNVTPEKFYFWNRIINYGLYDEFFNLYSNEKKVEINPYSIDYNNPHWWDILEEGDEIYVVNNISTDGIIWNVKIGVIIEVTEQDVTEIAEKVVFICFDYNKYRANFTYNMVKLHKKKNLNNNNNDLSRVLNTIQQGVGSTGLNFPSRKCKIAIGSRLTGTAKSLGPSETNIKHGVFATFQHV